MSTQSLQSIALETAKRRTFAIISHPDAGKTTLTEKLLLYSGMVRTAGMVRGRKGSKATSSDWMAMEQERGISITASAMQFEYKDTVINLLDTPGHQDFSEDTYRTLTAADCAVMVIDAAKGVETQTRKLFEVCRLRGVPTITFINKMDLPARDIFDLLDELEKILGVHAVPQNWPIGSGRDFVGVIDVASKNVSLFEKSGSGGSHKAQMMTVPLQELESKKKIESDVLEKLKFEMELLAGAGNEFDQEKFLAGKISPVFFGSALTNFGVEPFFDSFVSLAPPPHEVKASKGNEEVSIQPEQDMFSGFVFKIQANMNPKHRDSMAFLKICSGMLERDMTVKHHRTGKEVRLSRSYTMSGQDRNTIDYSYPGDIVGAINPGVFAIGDTISTGKGDFNFRPMPQFPPEIIAQIRPKDVMKKKQFDKGVEQLCNEGAVQLLRSYESPQSSPYIAAVGRLQFDVMQFRIKEEYGVDTHLDVMPYKYSAWLIGDPKTLKKTQSSFMALDSRDRVVVLFTGEWEKNYLLEKNPDHKLHEFVN